MCGCATPCVHALLHVNASRYGRMHRCVRMWVRFLVCPRMRAHMLAHMQCMPGGHVSVQFIATCQSGGVPVEYGGTCNATYRRVHSREQHVRKPCILHARHARPPAHTCMHQQDSNPPADTTVRLRREPSRSRRRERVCGCQRCCSVR